MSSDPGGQKILPIELVPLPQEGEVWQHKKSGKIYSILCVANRNVSDEKRFPPYVTYQIKNTNFFSIYERPWSEFYLKFKKLSLPNSEG